MPGLSIFGDIGNEVILVLLGALIPLVTGLVGDFTRRRMDPTTPWDAATLEVYSTFSALAGSVMRSASKEAARERMQDALLVYKRLVLIGSSDAVLAADQSRLAGVAYVLSLPDTDDTAIDGDGEGIAYTTGGARRVVLSKESTDLQAAGFTALNSLVEAARKQLRIKPLRADVIVRPL